jgi:hypothetical protein
MKTIATARNDIRRKCHPSGSTARRMLIVLTLVLGVLLQALSGPVAQAAPPESFTISVNGELVYKVHGTYQVTYVAAS